MSPTPNTLTALNRESARQQAGSIGAGGKNLGGQFGRQIFIGGVPVQIAGDPERVAAYQEALKKVTQYEYDGAVLSKDELRTELLQKYPFANGVIPDEIKNADDSNDYIATLAGQAGFDVIDTRANSDDQPVALFDSVDGDDWDNEGTGHYELTAEGRNGESVTILQGRQVDLTAPAAPAVTAEDRINEILANRTDPLKELPTHVDTPFGRAKLRIDDFNDSMFQLKFEKGSPFVVNGKDYSEADSYIPLSVDFVKSGRAEGSSYGNITPAAEKKLADWAFTQGGAAAIMTEENLTAKRLSSALSSVRHTRKRRDEAAADLDMKKQAAAEAATSYRQTYGADTFEKDSSEIRSTLPATVDTPFGRASLRFGGTEKFTLDFKDSPFVINGKDYSKNPNFWRLSVDFDAQGNVHPSDYEQITPSARQKLSDWAYKQGGASTVMTPDNLAKLEQANALSAIERNTTALERAEQRLAETEEKAVEAELRSHNAVEAYDAVR
ncbi:hypothetical protein [Leifsonia sp. Leaf264]|uniref:hypothetical protein n=1 Tax=Leifsonia sp. Leaf264 TaxID=1736314 RepID=UPI0006F6ADC7|nr:hypothetical protein [Leifsonia sp. Leaf264]KQO98810.1 hypothetical protein ASF30_12165 [Leifsonia sp. Leaf264]